MKYILIWFVSQWVFTSCPDFVPNPYTGAYPNTMCAVNHGRTVEKEMRREFNSMEELDAFKKNAPPECHGWKIIDLEATRGGQLTVMAGQGGDDDPNNRGGKVPIKMFLKYDPQSKRMIPQIEKI